MSDFSLMDLFRTEAETNTAVLAEGVLALEKGAPPAKIEELMRAAHSLKGAARIVNLDAAAGLAHVLEDYFVGIQKSKIKPVPSHVDVLLRGIDLLARLAKLSDDEATTWLAENESAMASYVTNFESLLAGQGGAPEPAPSPKAKQAPPPAPVEAPPPAPVEATPQQALVIPQAGSPAEPAPPATLPDRVVRVTADSLTRLMGLAGEALVEARQLGPYVGTLKQLKQEQAALAEHLQALEVHGFGEGTQFAVARDLVAQARNQAGRCQALFTRKIEELEDFAHRSEDLSSRLHHEIVTSRLRPLSEGIRGFPRLVRDIARQLGKEVRFDVKGDHTGVDRDVLDKLEAPLNHLIRNSLDHGVESPQDRKAAGKPAAATIALEAHHRAGMLQITLRDDGRGIDREKLRRRVVERGLTSPALAEKMSEAELFEFLFLPGFTTKDSVSQLSGRGVGLDVVLSTMQSLGGTVRVSSVPGRETSFSLRLPITMSVIRALLVEIAGEPYAFPLPRIDRIEVVSADKVQWLEGRRYFMLEGQAVGLLDASEVLELNGHAADQRTELPAVIVSDRGYRFGLVVERFLGERDLDVRPLDPRLGKVPNLNSATVLEGGHPVLIFDVEDLVRSIDNQMTGRRHRRPEAAAAPKAHTTRRILVVDDSITVRELERQLLETSGFEVAVAVDGMDGWNAVRSAHFDLVVSDIDMPRMDGFELVKRIKQDERLKRLPVVIVSYKDREEDRIRGLDAGADYYLTKSSFHDQTFLAAVQDLLGG